MSLYLYDISIRDDMQSCGINDVLIAGVDEAGRGPLAGPVYAAAVILPLDSPIEGINDSKKLTEKRRDALFDEIISGALAYCIASSDSGEIDEINILQATLLAMRRAVDGLSIEPTVVLVDGISDPYIDIPTTLVTGGDAKSASIAAASILAKVARDRHMLELGQQYPQWHFHRHKGYGTKLHYEMLDEFGPSPIHRQTFLRKWKIKSTASAESE